MRALRHRFQIVAKRGQNNLKGCFFVNFQRKEEKMKARCWQKTEAWKPLPPKNSKAKRHSPRGSAIFLVSLSSFATPPLITFLLRLCHFPDIVASSSAGGHSGTQPIVYHDLSQDFSMTQRCPFWPPLPTCALRVS